MTEWNIRKATDGDASAMGQCMKAAYAVYVDRNIVLPSMTASDCLKDIVAEQVWLVEVGEHIAGALVLGQRAKFMQLANVCLHPDYHGRGIGGALMAFAEAEARRQGYGEMCLATHVELIENIRLYEHLGWLQTNTSGNKIFMSKPLEPTDD